jgi:hypothetical protein
MTEQTTQQKNNRKGGRPPLLQIEKRSVKYHGGFTIAEAEFISQKAKAAGIPESEYVRHAVLNRELKTVPPINKDSYIELGKIGTNINQIAHNLNINATLKEKDRINSVFNQFKFIIIDLRKQLLGIA